MPSLGEIFLLTELKKLPRLENAQLGGKRVLFGVDYDDSLAFSSSPSGNPSLLPILSTVNFLLERGASIYIFSHSASFSPSNLATQLSKSLEREVDCISFPLSTEARESHLNISQGNISVLEIAKGTLEGSGNLSSLSHDLISLVLLTKISHLVKALMGNPVRSRNVPSSKTIQKQSSKENHD